MRKPIVMKSAASGTTAVDNFQHFKHSGWLHKLWQSPPERLHRIQQSTNPDLGKDWLKSLRSKVLKLGVYLFRGLKARI